MPFLISSLLLVPASNQENQSETASHDSILALVSLASAEVLFLLLVRECVPGHSQADVAAVVVMRSLVFDELLMPQSSKEPIKPLHKMLSLSMF